MGFFSDLGKKTSEATGKIARKTSETTGKIAKETKLKIKINENKNKINDIYEEIGKKVYEKHVREDSVCIKEDIQEECAKIDALAKEIEDARLEILKLNQKRLCSKCGAEIEIAAVFCPKCGEKQTEEPTVQEEALEKLENAEVEPNNTQEAEDAKVDLKEEIKEQEEQQ